MRFIPKILVAVIATLIATAPVLAATPFIWNPGTGNNGLYASLLTLESTELNSLTTGSVAVSTVGGSSGLFTNSNTGQAIWASVYFNAGTAGGSCSVGGNISIWFLTSPNGSTFEATGSAPQRAPDVYIALPATTLNATFKAPGLVQVPAENFKVLAQNNCGQTLAASANTITLAPLAVQY